MTAPLSVGRPDAVDRAPAGDEPHPPMRLVSVSPKALATADHTDGGLSMFITPRVIDQDSFDELATALRALIDEARQASRRLAAHITQADGADGRAAKAAVDLQERLRLGARLLNAFQSQIVRIETSIAELETHEKMTVAAPPAEVAEEALAAFRAQVEAATEQALARIESRAEVAADQVEEHLAGALRGAAERLAEREAAPGLQSAAAAELSAGGD